TTEIYALSLHDALPISGQLVEVFAEGGAELPAQPGQGAAAKVGHRGDAVGSQAAGSLLPDAPDLLHRQGVQEGLHLAGFDDDQRSEEHTSELQSRENLV